MKRFLIKSLAILLFGSLLISCNETFEPQVNFGNRTYTNDYTGLIEQTKQLVEKINALNNILSQKDGTLLIKLDAITNAINAQTTGLSSDLSEIVKALLCGFQSIKTTIASTGCGIIYAINHNGEIIALQIDENGKLLSTAVYGSAEYIANAINNQTASFETRMGGISTAITTGLLGVEAKINSANQTLELKLTDINDALGKIDKTILDGFKVISTSIDDNGDNIVKAINANGDKITLQIDKAGYVVSLAIGDAAQLLGDLINKLIATLDNQNASVEQKLNALNNVLSTGLSGINTQLGNLGASISVNLGQLKDMLGTKLDGILGGLTALTAKVDANGDKIVTAINANGEILALHMDKNGDLICTSTYGSAKVIADAINDLKATFASKIDNLNLALTSGLVQITAKLDGLDGIELKLADINTALGKIDGTLLDNFTVLSTTIGENGESIVKAINDNGSTIALEIGKNGNVISIAIADAAEVLADLIEDLADKLDDQNATLADKLQSLNTLLSSGFGTVGIQVGNLGTQLAVSIGSLKDYIGDKLNSILGGLTTLASKVGENNEKVVTAINNHGDLIALHLDQNGNLLKATLEGSTADIVKAINSQTTSFETKIDALNTALCAGLLGIETKIDAAKQTIELKLTDINTTLGKIDGTLLDGFTVVKKSLDTNGNNIVLAINEQGEAIALKIDKAGEAISIAIADAADTLSGLIENLIDALDDQNAAIEDKLDALNTLLSSGLGDIKVELGNLGTTLTVNLGELKDLLGNKLDAVLGGLTALSTKMDNNGDKIVSALNANGELIQLELKSNGQIIKVDLLGKLDEIIAALKSQSTSAEGIENKLDAINTVLTNGLGEIKVSVDAQTAEIKLDFKDLSDKIGDLGTTLLGGFNTLNASLADLVTKAGEIKVAIDNNTQAILTLDADTKAALKALQDEIKAQGGNIVTAINDNGTVIALALGKDGDLYKVLNLGVGKLGDIEAAILANGQSLKDLLTEGNKTAADILAALGVQKSQIADILQAIKDNKVDLDPVIKELKAANYTLTEILKISDGIYLDSNDYVDSLKQYKYIYITTVVREAAQESTEVDEGLMSILVGHAMSAPSKKQYAPQNKVFAQEYSMDWWHNHCFWRQVKQWEPFLHYCDVTTDKDEKTLLKMEKYYGKSTWLVKIHDVCSFAHIYGIKVKDAVHDYDIVYEDKITEAQAKTAPYWNKGEYEWTNGSGTLITLGGPIEVDFVSYDKATDTFEAEPNAQIFCCGGNAENQWGPYSSGGQQAAIADDGHWPEYNKAKTEKYNYLTPAY